MRWRCASSTRAARTSACATRRKPARSTCACPPAMALRHRQRPPTAASRRSVRGSAAARPWQRGWCPANRRCHCRRHRHSASRRSLMAASGCCSGSPRHAVTTCIATSSRCAWRGRRASASARRASRPPATITTSISARSRCISTRPRSRCRCCAKGREAPRATSRCTPAGRAASRTASAMSRCGNPSAFRYPPAMPPPAASRSPKAMPRRGAST